MLEENVALRCRQKDVGVVQELVPECLKILKSLAGQDCRLEIDRAQFLPPDCAGGVELFAKEGKIHVVGTLESRLDLISQNVSQKC